MATKVFFINSETAEYSDEEFSWFQTSLLAPGVIGSSTGVMGLGVTQNGTPDLSVLVALGRALVAMTIAGRHFNAVFESDAQVQKTIAPNSSGSNRVDAVIVRIDKDTEPNALKNNIGTIEVITGSGASALSDGAITTAVGSDGWLRLANVTIPNSDTTIENAQIADTRVRVAITQAVDLPGGVPAGAMFDFGGGTVPTGYLACDGSTVNRTTYANLFAAIGVVHGAGNGSTTFHLPDSRGRVTMGDGTGQWTTDFTFTQSAVSYSSDGTTEVITATAHGLVNGDIVYLYNTGGIPAATVNTPYYVISATANTFQIAATPNGSAINLSTGTGVNTFRKVPNITVPANTVLYSGTPVYIVSNGGTLPTAADILGTDYGVSIDGSGNIAVGTGLAADLPPINSRIWISAQSSTNLSALTAYYVISHSGTTFQVSATLGGAQAGSGNSGSLNYSSIFTPFADLAYPVYAIRISPTVIQLAGTKANAILGIPIPMQILTGGTGTFKVMLSARTLAEKGGEEVHQPNIPELVRHRHGLFDASAGAGITTGDNSTVGSSWTDYEGQSQPFNVLSPYLVAKKIIKY